MKYYMVFGTMFNKIVAAEDESKVNGRIIRELTKEEAEEIAKRTGRIENID